MGKRIIASGLLMVFLTYGCYNTYYISRDQLATLQTVEAEQGEKRSVTTAEGESVVVEGTTGLYVRSVGGRRYPITPFNFKLTGSQLVASDRDTLLALDGLREEAEVTHLSTWKTVLFISAGVAAGAGLIAALVVTGGSKTF